MNDVPIFFNMKFNIYDLYEKKIQSNGEFEENIIQLKVT